MPQKANDTGSFYRHYNKKVVPPVTVSLFKAISISKNYLIQSKILRT